MALSISDTIFNPKTLLEFSMMTSTRILQFSSFCTIDGPNSPSQTIASLEPNACASNGVG